MATETRTLAIGREEGRAALAAGVAGGVALGGVVHLWSGPDAVARYGEAAGLSGATAGWAVVLVLAVALAVAFSAVLSRAVNPYVNLVFALSRRSARVRAALLPAVQRAALPVTALNLGVGYGLALGVVVHWFVLPAALSASVPDVDLAGLVGWLAYGAVAGLVYGLVMER